MTQEELKRYLIKCCYWYYNQANPLISDYKFDMLFKELQTMEGDDIDPTSPTQMIYGERGVQYEDWAKER